MALSYSSCINRGFSVKCCAVTVEEKCLPRTKIRLGLPSEGTLATDTIRRLKDCRLSVNQVTPPQYASKIPQLPNLEVWFRRPKDIVRNLVSGDLDLGFVGLDLFCEYGQGNEDLILVHDALDYSKCRLSLGILKNGIFENINSLKELAEMPLWTPERPLRVVTDFTYLGSKFLKENGLKHVKFLVPDSFRIAAPKITARVRGSSRKDVTERILKTGLQGATISPVYRERDREGFSSDYYAISTCVPNTDCGKTLKQLDAVGKSEYLGLPAYYIADEAYTFDEESPTSRQLLKKLGL